MHKILRNPEWQSQTGNCERINLGIQLMIKGNMFFTLIFDIHDIFYVYNSVTNF